MSPVKGSERSYLAPHCFSSAVLRWLYRAEVGTERKDVGDQALIRGSTPHFRLFARGCLCLGSGVDLEDRPHILPEDSPTVAPSPPLHEGFQLSSSLSCTVLLLCGEFYRNSSWSLTAYGKLYRKSYPLVRSAPSLRPDLHARHAGARSGSPGWPAFGPPL